MPTILYVLLAMLVGLGGSYILRIRRLNRHPGSAKRWTRKDAATSLHYIRG